MSLYIIRERSNDDKWRFYRGDGERISDLSWDDQPSQMDLVEVLAEEHSGASILGNPDARWEYTQIVTNGIVYRGDDDQLPWEDSEVS